VLSPDLLGGFRRSTYKGSEGGRGVGKRERMGRKKTEGMGWVTKGTRGGSFVLPRF